MEGNIKGSSVFTLKDQLFKLSAVSLVFVQSHWEDWN